MSFFNLFDTLSIKPSILVKGEPRFYTKVGIYFGILSIFSFLILSAFFLNDVLSYKKINLIYNLDNRRIPSVNLTTKYLGILILDPLGNEYENFSRIMNLQAKFWDVKIPRSTKNGIINSDNSTKVSIDIIDIPLIDCKQIKTNLNSLTFMGNLYKTAKCFDFSSHNITIHGKIGANEGYSFLNVYLNKCVNSTNMLLYNRSDCLPQVDIDKKLFQMTLTILLSEFDINPQNIEIPLLEYTKLESLQISATVFKTILKNLNEVVWNDDKGLIFEDFQTLVAYRTDSIGESVDLRGSNTIIPGTFNQIQFRCSGKTEIFSRSFMKFQTAFANIAGILQVIFFIGRIIVIVWSENSLLNFLIMESFNIEESKKFLESRVNFNEIKNLLNNNFSYKTKETTAWKQLQDINSEPIVLKNNKQYIKNSRTITLKDNKNFKKKILNDSIENDKIVLANNNTSNNLLINIDIKNKTKIPLNFNKRNENNNDRLKQNFNNYSQDKLQNKLDLNDSKNLRLNFELNNAIKKNSFIDKKEKNEYFGFFDKFCLNNCIFDKNKKEFVYFAKKIVNRKLSIEYMLEVFNRLEQLKILILNDEQTLFFKSKIKLSLEKHLENLHII